MKKNGQVHKLVDIIQCFTLPENTDFTFLVAIP